jgi:hypothetical protein
MAPQPRITDDEESIIFKKGRNANTVRFVQNQGFKKPPKYICVITIISDTDRHLNVEKWRGKYFDANSGEQEVIYCIKIAVEENVGIFALSEKP